MACPKCEGTMYKPENLEAFLNGVAGNVECMCGHTYHHQAAGLVSRMAIFEMDGEIETTADLIAKHNREVEWEMMTK